MHALPTPPQTVQKSHPIVDKENQPPTCSSSHQPSLRVPRVVFARENRHHPYAHKVKPLPPAKMLPQPTRSILKPSLSPLPTTQEPTRESTPEGEDPLTNPLLLSSPVNRLVSDDPQATQHDITEAYSTLGNRLRAHFKSQLPELIPALDPLRLHHTQLATSFVRDLGKPLEPTPCTSSDEEELDVLAPSLKDNLPASSGSKKKGVTAQQITYARDAFVLVQTTIRTVAVILGTRALYSCFSDDDLTAIIDALLAIPLADKLYTPNSRKTTMLAMWGLSSLRVPSPIFAPLAPKFVDATTRALEGKLGKEGKKGAGCEALSGIHALSRLYPESLLPLLPPLVYAILDRCAPSEGAAELALVGHTMSLRAASAMGGIALGLLNWSRSPSAPLIATRSAIAEATTSFFTTPQDEPTPPSARLAEVILHSQLTPSSASNDDPFGPQWSASLLASVTVCLSSLLFACPEGIQLVLEAFQAANSNGKGKLQARTLVRSWWPTVIWAAAQVPEGDVWGRVRTVKGAPASFVGALMASGTPKRPRLVLRFVEELIKDNQPVGIHLLSRLVSGEDQVEWDTDSLVVRPLLDGSVLTHESRSLYAFAKEVAEDSVSATLFDGELPGASAGGAVQPDGVIPFEGVEVVQWASEVASVWCDVVKRISFSRGEDVEARAPPILLTIWTNLLKAHVPVLQGTGDKEHDDLVLTSLVDLIDDAIKTFSSPSGKLDYPRQVPKPQRPYASLTFVRALWGAVTACFSSSFDHPILSKIPALMLETLFDTSLINVESPSESRMFELWSEFVCDVLLHSSAGALAGVCEDCCIWEDGMSRMLWAQIARRVVGEGEAWGVAEGLGVLGVPFSEVSEGPISISVDLWNVWDELLARTVQKAVDEGRDANEVLAQVGEMLNNCGNVDVPTSLRTAGALLSRLELPSHASSYSYRSASSPAPQESDEGILGTDLSSVLLVVNNVLQAVLPSSLGDVFEVDAGVRFTELLGEFLGSVPGPMSLLVLHALRGGLAAWFTPAVESGVDYNERIVPLYSSCLTLLGQAAPSMQVLESLEGLFVSVFEEPPAPAAAPELFAEFWRTHYQAKTEIAENVPELLGAVLEALGVCHVDLGAVEVVQTFEDVPEEPVPVQELEVGTGYLADISNVETVDGGPLTSIPPMALHVMSPVREASPPRKSLMDLLAAVEQLSSPVKAPPVSSLLEVVLPESAVDGSTLPEVEAPAVEQVNEEQLKQVEEAKEEDEEMSNKDDEEEILEVESSLGLVRAATPEVHPHTPTLKRPLDKSATTPTKRRRVSEILHTEPQVVAPLLVRQFTDTFITPSKSKTSEPPSVFTPERRATSSTRKRNFLAAVEVPTAASLNLRPLKDYDLSPLKRKRSRSSLSSTPKTVTDDVFLTKRRASSAKHTLFQQNYDNEYEVEEAVAPQEGSDPVVALDGAPGAFDGTIMSSGLRKYKTMEAEARTSSSPLCDQRLNRTKSAPSIGIERSSTPTQSLNAIQAQLENVVGDPKSMSLEELQRFGDVLIGLQNQLAQAIEAKSRHEDN